MNDFPVSELRKVVLTFIDASRKHESKTEVFCHHSQVELLLKATLELHYQPGFNPHVRAEGERIRQMADECQDPLQKRNLHGMVRTGETSRLWKADVCTLPFQMQEVWWSTPGLNFPKGAPKQKGASVASFWTSERIWTHPELVEIERKDQEDEDRAEAEWEG